LVLRRLWNQRLGSAVLIQPHHIDLADRHIRGEVVRLLDSGYDAIVTGDVLQRAGEVERQLRGDYAKEQLGKGAATCAFLYSISAATRDAGATEEEIRTALLRPDVNPAMVSEVLGRLREGLWYLRYRDRRYLFTAKQNLNKVILDFESKVADDQVEAACREWLGKLAGKGGGVFQVIVAPQGPELVPDRAQPTLVVLPVDVTEPLVWMKQAVQSAGEGIRTNKNMLVFLVPDPTRLHTLRPALRRWLALKDVEQSPSFKEMDKEDQEQVRGQLKDKEAEVEALLRQAYQEIYRPSDSGVTRVSSISPEAIKTKTLDEFVKEALERAGVLAERVAPEYLQDTFRIEQGKEVPVSQIVNTFTGVPGQTIPADPQKAVQEAVQEGVRQGLFGLRVGERVFVREEVPEEAFKRSDVALVPSEEKEPPPPPVERGPLTLVVRTSANLLYPLLQAAQMLKNLHGASVSLEVHDPTGGMAEFREELEKLLQEYGCTFEWMEDKPGFGT
ncbi:MAG: DUF499 domain-containing protein, partial [Armatimonadota bacterium]